MKLKRFFAWVNPKTNVKDTVQTGLNLKQQKKIRLSRRAYYDQLKKIGKNNDPWAENAPDMSDFNQVLDHWGIDREYLPIIIRNLYIQMILFALGGVWGVWWIVFADSQTVLGLSNNLLGIPAVGMGILVITVRTWRVQVLETEKFVFFKDWFLGGVFSGVGRPTPFTAKKGGRHD